MYAIKYHNGRIDQKYVGNIKSDVWFDRGFWLMCDLYGDEWKQRFWKRLHPSLKDFKNKGFSIVKVKVIENSP